MPIKSFIDYLTFEKKYSEHTIIAYRKDLNTFRNFCIEEYGSQALLTIHYSQIRSWIVQLVDSGITNRSVNRKVSSLKSFYKFLQKTKQIEDTPLRKHLSLKVSKRVQVPFSQKEISSVIGNLEKTDDFKSMRNKLIVELFYSTGIRRNELIEIKINDVDFSNGTLKVLGKRNKERYIPLITIVQDSIKSYLLERMKLDTVDEYLFLTNAQKKMYPVLVYRIINDYFSRVSSKVKKSPSCFETFVRYSFIK